MAQWVMVAEEIDCPPGRSIEVAAGDKIVAVFNIDGQFHALHGACPHQGGPLGRGHVEDGCVTCPWHAWSFRVKDGQYDGCETLFQPSYSVRIEEGKIYVDVDSAQDKIE